MKVIIIDSNVIFRMIIKGKESLAFKVLVESLSKIPFITSEHALHELKDHILSREEGHKKDERRPQPFQGGSFPYFS